ncbi:MAG: quaternary ammonium compound-resistance protein SugE [Bacteroidetes bacterium HGW-Bacteroidetes-17]|jgi:quaternary ammonium compound-resistance protein SugE|nr:MAG: quaternary ammonium compound-resistance protein SugE [Bacteroidetes bacterium HGW-Bacteroidetes-17]
MAWIYLFLAGIFEVVWAIALKYSNGFSKLWPSIITTVGMAISIYFLAQALKSLPIGIAYAVWTGIGAIGTVILGMILFDESKDLIKIIFILFIVTGIVGLKIFSGNSTS